MGTDVPMSVPRLGLIKPGQTLRSVPNYGLFDSLAHFAILGELSSGLPFTVNFSRLLSFLLLSVGLFRRRGGGGGGRQGRTYLATPLYFSWLKKTKYQKRNFGGFLHKIWKTYLTTATLAKSWTGFMLNVFFPKAAFMSKTVAAIVQKMGSMKLKGGFLLQLFRTLM